VQLSRGPPRGFRHLIRDIETIHSGTDACQALLWHRKTRATESRRTACSRRCEPEEVRSCRGSLPVCARDFILRTNNGARLRSTSKRCVRARLHADERERARGGDLCCSPGDRRIAPRRRAESNTRRLRCVVMSRCLVKRCRAWSELSSRGARAATPQTTRVDRELFGPAPPDARRNSLTYAQICLPFVFRAIHPSELGRSRRWLAGYVAHRPRSMWRFRNAFSFTDCLSSRLPPGTTAATPQTTRMDRESFGPAPLEGRKIH
jgi:hypothetical protein